jgi:AraC family transcriptional regulator
MMPTRPPDKIRFLTPLQLQGAMPTNPILSSLAQSWSGIIVQRYQNPPLKVEVPGLRDHLLVVHLAGPLLVEEEYVSGKPTRRWAESGQISLTPAGHPAARTLKGRTDVLLIHIAPELVNAMAADIYGCEPGSLSLLPRLAVRDEMLSYLGRALQAEAETGAPGTSVMATSLSRAIALQVLRNHSSLAEPEPEETERAQGLPGGRLRRVIDHMRSHLDETLSLEKLAELGGLSASQFARRFREATGQSPHRFLTDLRIDRARKLLEATDQSVIDVGLECGFERPSHFSTAFRMRVGMSPRAWRVERRW